MSDRSILLVGGAGYIGSHVNKRLNQKGYQTIIFDNLSYGHRDFVKWGTFVLGDLCNIEQVRSCFENYKIDTIMHFGAYTYVHESIINPAKYYQNNIVNTLNLLNVMREFEVHRCIFSSSCATYGNPLQIPITETHPQHPVNPYGRTKLMIEKILKDYDDAYGMKHVNLRYFNAAGADPDGEIGERHDPEFSLIPLALYAALGINDHISIFGTDYPTKDGTCIRDYIHVVDIADAHIKALEYIKTFNLSDSFNLGSEKGHSVIEVIETVQKITGTKFNVIHCDRRTGDPPQLISSSQKAFELLDWETFFKSIESIVETAWLWHKADIDNIIKKDTR
jgi:UDP-glucose 4-epimerase